ncbi:glycoside hydrolase family 16 protein [Nocardioides panacisoli]|uniref:Glycoside hydrolase family 16 protein n=1 Tax=Nocardioides panacisoli TaxID=627624 RepID=A0ABP7INP7_9ACTN
MATAVTGPTCGGQRPAKAGGGRYTCTFTDDFTGSTLDATKWVAQDTSRTGVFTSTQGCYVTGPDNISVSGGQAHLTSRVEDQPFTCQLPGGGGFSTTTSVATITTRGLFAQAYGRFEFRARFPNTSVAGFHSALWMYPQQLTYGPWPNSGEIDVAERLTAKASAVYASLHYAGSDTGDSGVCQRPTAGTAFHRYAVEWTPSQMRFIYDGVTCFTEAWAPDAPLVAPQPFDQPFDLIVSQAFGAGTNARTPATPTSGTTDVDWVRAWS